MKKKIVSIALVACLALMAIAGASLAYFTDTDAEENVFTTGKVDIDLVETFDEENAKLVKYAYEKGINYFDTAPGYCDDRSEAIFGVAFREMIKEGKTDFYVSTKGKPKVYDTAEKAIAAVKKSLEVMGVP